MALSDITPIKRSEEYLQRIADAIEGGGGSDLPAVTSDDNGDVLTVVNGAWDKATPSGGGLPKIHISGGGLLPGSLVSTYDDILAIHQTGSAAMLWSDNDSVDIVVLYPIPEYEDSGATIREYFGVVVNGFSGDSASTGIQSYNIVLADDGNTHDATFNQVIKTIALAGGI